MHELSIAVNIIKIAEEAAMKANASVIHKIELEIGLMAGIDFEALDFAMDTCVKGTMLENAERKITKIKAQAKCKDCGHQFTLNSYMDQCPVCKSYLYDVTKGKELLIRTLEVDTN